MSLDRRELLSFFGLGATIAPVVGGGPLISAAAKLVEPAKVELITPSDQDMPTTWTHRLEDRPFERLWLAKWRSYEAQNRLLQHLLEREPTTEERRIVAALMQWFGTNCGLGFLGDALRAEGYHVSLSSNGNGPALRMLDFQHHKDWPEFLLLRMKNGPPEVIPAARRHLNFL